MSSDMWLLDAARHQIDQLSALRISVHQSCLSEFRVIVADVASQIVVVADVDSERIIDYAESGTT